MRRDLQVIHVVRNLKNPIVNLLGKDKTLSDGSAGPQAALQLSDSAWSRPLWSTFNARNVLEVASKLANKHIVGASPCFLLSLVSGYPPIEHPKLLPCSMSCAPCPLTESFKPNEINAVIIQ